MEDSSIVVKNEDETDSESPTKDLVNIKEPHKHDVLCGRGITINRHPGNISFRRLVSINKELYVSSTKKQKKCISRAIVEAVRTLEPPGRFLYKNPNTGLWSDIGDVEAVVKTSQTLRDGAAEVRKRLSKDLNNNEQLQFFRSIFDSKDNSKEDPTSSSSNNNDDDGGGGKPLSSSSFKDDKAPINNEIDKSSSSTTTTKTKEKCIPARAQTPRKKGHRRTNSAPVHRVMQKPFTNRNESMEVQSCPSRVFTFPPHPLSPANSWSPVGNGINYSSDDHPAGNSSALARSSEQHPASPNNMRHPCASPFNIPSHTHWKNSQYTFYPRHKMPYRQHPWAYHTPPRYPFQGPYSHPSFTHMAPRPLHHSPLPNAYNQVPPREQIWRSHSSPGTVYPSWPTNHYPNNNVSNVSPLSQPEYYSGERAQDLWTPLPVDDKSDNFELAFPVLDTENSRDHRGGSSSPSIRFQEPETNVCSAKLSQKSDENSSETQSVGEASTESKSQNEKLKLERSAMPCYRFDRSIFTKSEQGEFDDEENEDGEQNTSKYPSIENNDQNRSLSPLPITVEDPVIALAQEKEILKLL